PMQDLLSFGDVQGHHHRTGFVWLGRRLAFIEIRSEGGKSGIGKTVGDGLDVANQTPPLLNDDHPASGAGFGRGKIALKRLSIAAKVDHFAVHGDSLVRREEANLGPSNLKWLKSAGDVDF